MSRFYLTRKEKRKNSHAYATINGINLLTEYKMELLSYEMGNPVPLIKLIDVPGRAGKLDATLALNGKVNYTTRSVSATFHVRDITYEDWHTLISGLYALLQGTESKLSFSTDPRWHYKGRFTVVSEKTNPVTGQIKIECSEAYPYKLEDYEVQATISSSKYVTCVGETYNGTITIYASAAMSVTFAGMTYQLVTGNNIMWDIHIKKGNNSLRFVGTGNIKITYERGIL